MKRIWLMGVLLTCAMAGTSLAVVPSTMTYQGVLASPSGAVVPDGDYWVRFRLYTAATGDTNAALWKESVQVQTVKGVFTAVLGNSESLASVPFDVPYWLGLSVADGVELAPRITLTASPYSLNSRGVPGIAQGSGLGARVDITSATTMVDVVTTTITIPTAGYIVVEAAAQHGMTGAASLPNSIIIQIDETADGSWLGAYHFVSGYSSSPGGVIFHPVSARRTYLMSSAGTYAFRLEAMLQQAQTSQSWLWNPVITATFFPRNYGTVTTAPAGPDGAQDGAGAPLGPGGVR